MSTLEAKLAARAGRLQLIVAALAQVCRANEDDDIDVDTFDARVDELLGLAGTYGTAWLDETAMLLKEQYNRKSGA